MKSSQWYIIGLFLILMSVWFIMIGTTWGLSCNIFDDSSPLNKADVVACVNAEILDPFIWILFPLGVIFNICGWIESRSERKK